MIYLVFALIIAALIGIGNITYRKIQPLPQKTKMKVCIIGGSIVVGAVLIFCVVHIISYFVNKPLTIEEYLLGEWRVEVDDGESTLTFEENDDGKITAEWCVYDYANKEWDEHHFTVKEIEDYIMTILTDDGQIQFIPFAISKDTLVFANIEYKNEEKDIPIPDSKYTYIVDGIIKPVTNGCYMGMSKDDIEKTVAPLEVSHSKPESYCMLPVDGENEIKMSFYFDDNYGLEEIHYWLEDYYSEKDYIISKLSDMYGDYEKSKWSGFDNYYRYTWCSGNLVIDLNEDIEEKQIWVVYSFKSDWVLDFMRNNQEWKEDNDTDSANETRSRYTTKID